MMIAQTIIQRTLAILPVPQQHDYGVRIGEFLTCGIDRVESPDTRETLIMPQMVKLFDETRRRAGFPIPVRGGFRTYAHECALTNAGYKAAKTISPHCLGAALDLDAQERTINGRWVREAGVNALIQQAARDAAGALGFPTPRLGHAAYNETFTHVDLVFMLFAPYTALPHPADWPELPEDVRTLLGKSWRPGVEW